MDKLICPVYAGMSLRTQTATIANSSVCPYPHGDEPEARIFVMDIKSLPRIHEDEPMKKAIHFVEGVSAPYVRG